MNQPEYIPVDEFALLTEAARVALSEVMPGFEVLNYQYGYVKELNTTLQQWSKNNIDGPKKFPLVWLEQPFNVTRGISPAFYGRIEVLRVFIINATKMDWKAEQRMTNNFKPIIHPIKRELLRQIDLSVAFHTQGVERIRYTEQDRYYWGEAQQSVLDDTIDCTILTIRDLEIANNQNCTPGQ